MAKQSKNKNLAKNKYLATSKKLEEPAGWVKILLTLSLVPMVVGILMIGAWALDMEFWEDPQAQVIIGLLFILLSFAASNALQKRWRLAAGWAVLAVSDVIILLWMNIIAQGIALGVGLVGLIIIILEFARHWKKS